jgi:hypothetical protein
MDGYALCDDLGEQLFRKIGGYFENFSGSVSRISEETYSQQAVYLSYTLTRMAGWLMSICRQSVMAQQRSASSDVYCVALAVSLGKS